MDALLVPAGGRRGAGVSEPALMGLPGVAWEQARGTPK